MVGIAPEFSPEGQLQISKSEIIELLAKRFIRLPEHERKLFSYGSLFMGFNGAFAGLIANSLFRRILNITQGRIVANIPMAVLPFLTTVATYNGCVCQPLLSGDLNCETCVIVRGALIGSVIGGLYPILLAIPVNGGLAARYSTNPLPTKGNIVRFWITISQPVLRKMSFVLILQAAFGCYISSRHYGIYVKMLQLPPAGSDIEELKD
ncbi:transmembrane protein 126A [Microcaecilia unicolor]|uniref:Transmembrane protein 126A n=1 Tax=Microcaecilia unicolor TaxID=1415580 RepID=A0A6P7XSD3_9AMPH|nr:transmembrane protein 126A [Microcaecilia unicolor]XP_030055970.1 transmembrane protein 126A [Microcaecilia unicolor]XP_030055971.1 transmembrane protein 126A [Microcaecilia unicolor]XP_030055972.1 transmembrane protein 126A [Microcaecilia unicolor]XP_030055973.1 transmembrane protein 126A [Microcaecilia unicolor]XP_030055974.1 transmembrane protein 126A [Microcaecilia unicolor]